MFGRNSKRGQSCLSKSTTFSSLVTFPVNKAPSIESHRTGCEGLQSLNLSRRPCSVTWKRDSTIAHDDQCIIRRYIFSQQREMIYLLKLPTSPLTHLLPSLRKSCNVATWFRNGSVCLHCQISEPGLLKMMKKPHGMFKSESQFPKPSWI